MIHSQLQRIVFGLGLTALFLAFFGCTPEIPAPDPQSGSADFSKVVALGDNYFSGYQNGALYEEGQSSSVSAIIARQMSQVRTNDFPLALLPAGQSVGLNAKPWVSIFQTRSSLGYKADCEGAISLSPVSDTLEYAVGLGILDPFTGTAPANIAVTSATTSDMMDPAFGEAYPNGNPFYHRITTGAGSATMLSDAVAQDASFYLLWAGMQDLYQNILKGDTRTMPSAVDFEQYLDQLLSGLSANGAKGAIANIPHYSHLPYFTTIPPLGAELIQSKADSLNDLYALLPNFDTSYVYCRVGSNGFVIDDPAAPQGLRQLNEEEYVLLIANLDSMRCSLVGVLFQTLPDVYVIDQVEAPTLDAAIANYNAVIASKAAEYGIPVVDVNSYFAEVHQGINVDGVDFTSEFAAGGFYSLDGYHLTGKGSALVANKFIEAINAWYGATIPPAQLMDYEGVRFP